MIRIAVVGCVHGELDTVYGTINYINKLNREKNEKEIELLLCCGDFQAIRNEIDLEAMACPAKYLNLGTFHEYYDGKKKAPVFTIFIGGNHEASNYSQELHYGGFVAPNIFYLGAAGVVHYKGLRIAGISGIYKSNDYSKGHYETFPYNHNTLRSVYHIREFEIFQLSHLSQSDRPIDIFLSHDWPKGIEKYGDLKSLLKKKPFFKNEIYNNDFGNPATEHLLHCLRPKYWFAGHLHCKYPAILTHTPDNYQDNVNNATQETKFLALAKCNFKHDFLQVLDLEPTSSHCAKNDNQILYADMEWLNIIKLTHHLNSKECFPKGIMLNKQINIKTEYTNNSNLSDSDNNNDENNSNLSDNKWFIPWPTRFLKSTPSHSDIIDILTNDKELDINKYRLYKGNPQTDTLLSFLKLPHIVTSSYRSDTDIENILKISGKSCENNGFNIHNTIDPNEINLEDI